MTDDRKTADRRDMGERFQTTFFRSGRRDTDPVYVDKRLWTKSVFALFVVLVLSCGILVATVYGS